MTVPIPVPVPMQIISVPVILVPASVPVSGIFMRTGEIIIMTIMKIYSRRRATSLCQTLDTAAVLTYRRGRDD